MSAQTPSVGTILKQKRRTEKVIHSEVTSRFNKYTLLVSNADMEAAFPSRFLTITLPVVVTDSQAPPPKQESSMLGLSIPRPVPEAAKHLTRYMINNNSFSFGDVLGSGILPTRGGGYGLLARWFTRCLGRPEEQPVCTHVFAGLRLIEEPSGLWFVELTWNIRGGTRLDIHDGKLIRMIEGSISDGWGEATEQLTYGPLVNIETFERRFSLTLTTLGGGRVWPY